MLMLEILLNRVLPWLFVGLGYWFLYQLVRQRDRSWIALSPSSFSIPTCRLTHNPLVKDCVL